MARPTSRPRKAELTVYNEDGTKLEFSLFLKTMTFSKTLETSPVFALGTFAAVHMVPGPALISIRLEGIEEEPASPRSKRKGRKVKMKTPPKRVEDYEDDYNPEWDNE